MKYARRLSLALVWMLIQVLAGYFSPQAFATELPFVDGGNVKLRWLNSSYPDGSAYQPLFDDSSNDKYAGLRLKFHGKHNAFSVNADYQLLGQHGDAVKVKGNDQGQFGLPPTLPTDDRRWWDLTHTISDSDDGNDSSEWIQRLDRLNVGYTGDNTVVRFGRQAVSWGNGLIFNPMDFFNPFNPAAVDTEYKLGEDMLYAQYLLDSGSDWQFVNVQRRDERGHVSSQVSSSALKFHSFGLEREYDLLLAEHFDQFIGGAGAVINLGESVLRGDITVTDGHDDWVTSFDINWSYSWVWGGYNVSAVAEYFYNGFGLSGSNYTLQKILADKDLYDRLQRGELFTVGRNYLAGSMMLELTPLLNITPNLFINLNDGSTLAQLVAQWDLGQNWQLLGALNAPLGSDGSEYGGLETGVDELYLAVDLSLFVQLAWYF